MKFLILLLFLFTLNTQAGQMTYPLMEKCHTRANNEVFYFSEQTGDFQKITRDDLITHSESRIITYNEPVEFFIPTNLGEIEIPSQYVSLSRYLIADPSKLSENNYNLKNMSRSDASRRDDYRFKFKSNNHALKFKQDMDLNHTTAYLFRCKENLDNKTSFTMIAITKDDHIMYYKTRIEMQHESW